MEDSIFAASNGVWHQDDLIIMAPIYITWMHVCASVTASTWY
jgi:hypothetical protein